MKILRLLLTAILLSLCGGAAHGQCYFQFNYTGSQTVTAGSVSFTNQTTRWTNAVIVDGTASMTAGQYGCPPLNGTPTHRPWISNQLNNLNIPLTGGSSNCVSCYIHYEIDQSEDIGFGVDFTAGGTTQVSCTVAGAVFLATWGGSSGNHFESASTLVQNTDPAHGQNRCNLDGAQFANHDTFEIDIFMPGYGFTQPDMDTCYYPIQNWCLNAPDANYNNTSLLMPQALISGSMTNDARYFPQPGGYYLTLIKPLWRISTTSAWHELNPLGSGNYAGWGADPHYGVTSAMAKVNCTSNPSSASDSLTFGPQ